MKMCIIACSSVLLGNTLGVLVHQIDRSYRIRTVQDRMEIADLLDGGSEQFLFIDRFVLGIHTEKMLRLFFRKNPRLRVACIAESCERQYGMLLVRNGVESILCGIPEPESFFLTVRSVLEGGKYIPSYIREALENREYVFVPEYMRPLTAREQAVLECMVQGKSIKETGDFLRIAGGTVSALRNRGMGKLGASNIAEMCRIAKMTGIRVEGDNHVGENERLF